jgi:hypothetical protein
MAETRHLAIRLFPLSSLFVEFLGKSLDGRLTGGA